MINLVSVKCPECGATLNIESDRREAFCSYCGAKVFITNENEHIIKTVDVAAVKEIEAAHDLEVKKLALREKAMEANKKYIKYFAIGFVVLLVFLLVLLIKRHDSSIGLLLWFLVMIGLLVFLMLFQRSEDLSGKITVPEYRKKDINLYLAELQSCGFNNVTTIPVNKTLLQPHSIVTKVTANGRTVEGVTKCMSDASIVVYFTK